MVTTNNAELAKEVKLLRNHGYAPKYYNKVVGGNFRLDAIQAAVLRIKLKYLDSWTEKRQQNAATYRRLFMESELAIPHTSPDQAGPDLSKMSGVVLPFELPNVRHIYNQFVIRSGQRDQLMAHLKARKIGTEVYYPVSIHAQDR